MDLSSLSESRLRISFDTTGFQKVQAKPIRLVKVNLLPFVTVRNYIDGCQFREVNMTNRRFNRSDQGLVQLAVTVLYFPASDLPRDMSNISDVCPTCQMIQHVASACVREDVEDIIEV